MAATKVLHCTTGLNIGGAELMLSRFLGGVRRETYLPEVLSLLPLGPVAKQISAMEIGISTLNMKASSIRPRNFWALRREVRKARPDLIHGWMYHGNAAASIGSLLSLRFPPIIWSIHHSIDDIATEKPMTRRIIRLLARLSSRVAGISYCSQVSAEQHEALGFDASKRHIIPNGIDCEIFKPLPEAGEVIRRQLNIPLKRKIIGNIARFHPMKDQAGLVRAVALLLQQGHDVQGLIVGAGHEKGGPVMATARELGIESRISLLGARDDVPKLLPGIDVYALSSAWGEAFPLAVAEAMACGVPAIVTDIGDCAWLVGETGTAVPPGNRNALAGALAEVLKLPKEDRKHLGMQARKRVMENFSLERYVSEHEALYAEVLQTNAGQTSRRVAW
jgi:glycosyltransferase involved in cell wall biosynthesis